MPYPPPSLPPLPPPSLPPLPLHYTFLPGFHHAGDTPNSITDAEFESMGEVSEGYSGSDIAIVVSRRVERSREAEEE